MKGSRFTADPGCLVIDKPFEEVIKAFEQPLRQFDPDVCKALATSGDNDRVKTGIVAIAGLIGFVCGVQPAVFAVRTAPRRPRPLHRHHA
jgi:hypothetical protein